MKFTMSAAALSAIVTDAARAVPARPTQVVYSGLHIAAARGKVRVTGASDTVTMLAGGPASVATAGDVQVAAEPLTSWLSLLPASDDVTVEATSGIDLTVSSGSGATSTFPLRSDRLPEVSWGGASGGAKGVADLRLAVSCAAVVAPEDVVRLRSRDGRVSVDATDRIRVVSTSVAADDIADFDVVIPLSALKMLSGRPLTAIQVAGTRVRLVASSAAATFQVSELAVQDVSPLLTAAPPHVVHVDRAELVAVLDRMSRLTTTNGTVDVEVSGTTMLLKAASETVTSAAERVAVTCPSGMPVEARWAISVGFLLDAVRSLPSSTVAIGYGAGLTPVHVTDAVPRPDGPLAHWVIALRKHTGA